MENLPEYTKLNSDLKQWADQTKKDLRTRLSQLNIRETGALMQKLSYSLGKNYGQVNRIRIRFHRYGIFVEKGAGKGYGGLKGSKWDSPKGGKRSTKESSLGKMGTGKRKAKPWFNPIIESEIEILAEIIEGDYKEIIVANVKHFKIK